MKTLVRALLFTLLLAYPLFANAAPFLVCDPYVANENVDQFVVTMDGGAPQTVTAQIMPDSKTRLYYDLSSLTSGAHSVTAKAKSGLWGVESVSSVPFVFTKPASSSAPVGIGIIK